MGCDVSVVFVLKGGFQQRYLIWFLSFVFHRRSPGRAPDAVIEFSRGFWLLVSVSTVCALVRYPDIYSPSSQVTGGANIFHKPSIIKLHIHGALSNQTC